MDISMEFGMLECSLHLALNLAPPLSIFVFLPFTMHLNGEAIIQVS